MELINLFYSYPQLVVCVAVIFGLLVGSFLNVVIYRLPIMMQREWQSECRLLLDMPSPENPTDSKFNLSIPHSHCPHCNTAIKPWQNIPVISYLLLKGRCGSCSTPISLRYPSVEAFSGLLCGIVAWQLNTPVEIIAAVFFTWALISLTMIDVDHKLLPDQITLPLLWAGLLLNSFNVFVPLMDAVWGAIIGYLILWSVYWAFKLLTGKEGMGYGDFKLLAALGAWMGWQLIPLIIILSSAVGAVLGCIILLSNRQGRDTALPFGPYLAAAGWISLLWGSQILASYIQFDGLH